MSLPEPNFIDRDPEVITAEIVALYEEKTEKTLYPAQIDRIMIDIIAYRETLVRQGIQEAAKQNLVAFAEAPMSEYLGQLVGVERLPEAAAVTFLQFSIATPLSVDLVIDVGTGASSDDGGVSFETDEQVTLSAGQLSVSVTATCTVAGTVGNGWLPGKIASLTDIVGDGVVDVLVTNTTTTSGGAAEEIDDALRERIRLAPDAYSVAGPDCGWMPVCRDHDALSKDCSMSTSSQYFTIITDAGLALEAQAKIARTPIVIAKIAVGDGNGAEYDPVAAQTGLLNEKWRGNLNALLQDDSNTNWWIAEAILPDEIGGFYIREVA